MKQTCFEPSQFYHIYNRANGAENVFQEPENYRYFLERYREKTIPVVDTIAYCHLQQQMLDWFGGSQAFASAHSGQEVGFDYEKNIETNRS